MDARAWSALVIDDEPFALKVLTHQLRRLGVGSVRAFDDARAALAEIDRDVAAVDLLFCDLNMPGMDGVEFVRHLAERRFGGGVVLVTGEDDRILHSVDRLARAHRLNVLDAIRKPVSAGRLRQLLQHRAAVTQAAPATGTHVYGPEDLSGALARGELVNHYQPQVALASGVPAGIEALVRWRHPRDGVVGPDRFIPLAEACGLVDAMTDAVVAAALRDALEWRRDGLDVRLSINVSMRSLASLDVPDRLAAQARAAGLPLERLVVEVTESQAMHDPRVLLEIATRLRLKRIGLSIDDFGTGYSSLAQLRDVPFDELKLDRSFVHRADCDPVQHAILEANLALARQLGLRTVAEGVEDRADWDCVRGLGCDLAQGFLIAAPMPADALLQWARQQAAADPPPQDGE